MDPSYYQALCKPSQAVVRTVKLSDGKYVNIHSTAPSLRVFQPLIHAVRLTQKTPRCYQYVIQVTKKSKNVQSIHCTKLSGSTT